MQYIFIYSIIAGLILFTARQIRKRNKRKKIQPRKMKILGEDIVEELN